jgi:hypothetical protein
MTKILFEKSSGNVFADIGFTPQPRRRNSLPKAA